MAGVIKRVNIAKGFTLLELIIIVILVGILSSIGFIQYGKMLEKSRTAEARTTLGRLRQAQRAYFLEQGKYTDSLDDLYLKAMPIACVNTHYFKYSTTSTNGTAQRCLAGENGRFPPGPDYFIAIDYDNGTWSGTPGYF